MSEEKKNVEATEEKVQEEMQQETGVKEKNNKGLLTGIIVAIVAIVLIVGGVLAYNNGLIGGISTKKIAGAYDLVEMLEDEQTYSKEDIDSLKALGLTISLELREDGTGQIDLFGETMELTYDDKNMTINGESAPYTVDGNRILLEQDGEKLVFEKTTGE